jgi:hypothetical protein
MENTNQEYFVRKEEFSLFPYIVYQRTATKGDVMVNAFASKTHAELYAAAQIISHPRTGP